ncbi:uncharacterized protein GGS22DRAFT_190254 [Annulohypoxylon maeteangense]|uniref:uncharacterized protein n=1 Tax=Annulohypoxylon maeteangense TaxID=1927788 RepID=UPI002007D2DE|nr:uncharacterized protein GGS22DRAFT_190254 [Annulohypoxylon maeteangense]KAI0883595.1 hypothetical protein GGS22DRAFT_190254 [Annulohypoxylon maeteangense]
MGSSDIAPSHAPQWLVPLSTVLLGSGVFFWCIAYVLITRRSIQTRSYGMPLLGLAINVSWEIVYGFYVAEMLFEKLGFTLWLILDLGLIYTTVKFAPEEWASTNKFVGRHMASILALMLAIGCWGHYAFVSWWLSRPGIGIGDKSGKWYYGQDGYDTTELAYWSAGVAQLVLSSSSVAMLGIRGHSGGTGYIIWLCRITGSLLGLGFCNGLLWWYWPEAHSYFTHPMSIFIGGVSLICDLVYPFVLWHVRQSERVMADGRLVGAHMIEPEKEKGQ